MDLWLRDCEVTSALSRKRLLPCGGCYWFHGVNSLCVILHVTLQLVERLGNM